MVKKVLNRLSEQPIRTALTILLFPFFLLLMICCIYFYISGVSHYSELVKENAESLVRQSRITLNQNIDNFQNGVDNILEGNAFYLMRSNIENGKEPIKPGDYVQLYTSLINFQQHYSVYVESIGLYLSDNSVYVYNSSTENNPGLMRYVDYTEFMGDTEDEMIWVSTAEIFPETIAEELPWHFAMILPLGTEKTELSGVFLIGIRDETLYTVIQGSRPTPGSRSVLISSVGDVITEISDGKDGSVLDMLDKDETEKIREKADDAGKIQIQSFETADYYVLYMPVGLRNTGILSVVPKDELYMSFRNFTHIFVLFATIVILLFLVLYFLIPRYFSLPVQKMLYQMEQINRPTGARKITVNGYREIRQIGQGINDMMDRIEILTESIQREMKAKQATQLQYLFAQINPHFLYNTLDCIRELCACGENDKAEEMIGQLAVFYRIGVSKGKSFITVEEEISHVSAYLSILKTRFEDFSYRIDLPDELKEYCVLRMILQPIAENAVYHGIRPYRMDGTVEISVGKEGGLLVFCIRDDGGGIAEDVLQKVISSLDEPICEYSEKSYGVYGLKNVQDRLQIAYGKQCRIRIETETDCGTEVIITIPCEKEHKNDKNTVCR